MYAFNVNIQVSSRYKTFLCNECVWFIAIKKAIFMAMPIKKVEIELFEILKFLFVCSK